MRSSKHSSSESFSSPAAARRRRRRAIVGFQLRVVGVAVAGVLSAFIAISVIKKTLHPYVLGHQEGTRIAQLQAVLDRKLAVNRGLEKRIAYLQSDEGRESEARRKGYHKPGEIVFLLDKPSTPADPPAAASPAPNPMTLP